MDLQVAIQAAGLDQGDRVLEQNSAILSQLEASLPYQQQMMEDLLAKVNQLLEQSAAAASPSSKRREDASIDSRLEKLLATSGATPNDMALATQTFQSQARVLALAGVDNSEELRTVKNLQKAEVTAVRVSMVAARSTQSRGEGELRLDRSNSSMGSNSSSTPRNALGAERMQMLARRIEIDPSEIELMESIGQGAFGEVHRAIFRKGVVAVKKMTAIRSAGPHAMIKFQHEVAMLCSIRHSNLLMIQGACLQPSNPFIVTEYCANGSLADVLKQSARALIEDQSIISPSAGRRSSTALINQLPLSTATRLAICTQILEGLVRLHESSPPIIHRDLKAANVLLDQRMNAKISDFGLAKTIHLSTGLTTRVATSPKAGGTICYMSVMHACRSPELLGENPPEASASSDMYSLGVCLWEVWTESVPWTGLGVHQIMRAVGDHKRTLDIPKTVPTAVADLIQSMFREDPTKRPTAAQALEQMREIEANGGELYQ